MRRRAGHSTKSPKPKTKIDTHELAMHVNQLKSSNFLKKEDCDPAVLVTIRECTEQNVAKEGAPEEMKWALHFDEFEKPMILNSTNGQIIAKITGSDDSDGWVGHKVVLYNDPNVSYAGKLIGGIRVRAARNQPAKQVSPVKPTPQAEPDPLVTDDDIPF